MFKMKPLYRLPGKFDLPTCMYSSLRIEGKAMKIHPSPPSDTLFTEKDSGREDDDTKCLKQLEDQQETILCKLSELKEQIEKLRCDLQLPVQSSLAVHAVENPTPAEPKSSAMHNLVINCDPRYPPYSLCILLQWLADCNLDVHTSVHVHSSVKHMNNKLHSFLPCDESAVKSNCHLALTLIWKEGEKDLSLVMSPWNQSVITGESNLARHISRIMPVPYNFELQEPAITAEIDMWLDLAQVSLTHGSEKQQTAVLKTLTSRLIRKPWLVGDKQSIADAVLWSTLRKIPQLKTTLLHVDSWMHACATLIKSQAESYEEEMQSDFFTKTSLLKLLHELGVKVQMVDHPAVFTVETMMEHVGHLPGAHTKNLFLKDKKKNYYLVSAKHDRQVNLSDLGKKIDVKELRFADEKVLMDVLGVQQGCVTAFALINDRKGEVKFVCDSKLLDGSFKQIYFHPLTNACTTGITPAGLKSFLTFTGHDPIAVNFAA